MMSKMLNLYFSLTLSFLIGNNLLNIDIIPKSLEQYNNCNHDCDPEKKSASDQDCGDCLIQTNTPHLTTTFSFNAYQLATKLFTDNNFFYKNLIQLYNYSLPPPKSY